MTSNQIASLLGRINLRINDRNHPTLRDHSMHIDLILVQQLIVLQQHEITELKRKVEEYAGAEAGASV